MSRGREGNLVVSIATVGAAVLLSLGATACSGALAGVEIADTATEQSEETPKETLAAEPVVAPGSVREGEAVVDPTPPQTEEPAAELEQAGEQPSAGGSERDGLEEDSASEAESAAEPEASEEQRSTEEEETAPGRETTEPEPSAEAEEQGLDLEPAGDEREESSDTSQAAEAPQEAVTPPTAAASADRTGADGDAGATQTSPAARGGGSVAIGRPAQVPAEGCRSRWELCNDQVQRNFDSLWKIHDTQHDACEVAFEEFKAGCDGGWRCRRRARADRRRCLSLSKKDQKRQLKQIHRQRKACSQVYRICLGV